MTARPMTEEREKLEPCPFCDRQMTLRPDGYYRHAFQRRGPLCVAEFVAVLAGDSVSAEKWNRRSTSAAERGMREALESIKRMPGPAMAGPTGLVKFLAYDRVVEIIDAALSGIEPGDEQARGQGRSESTD